MGSAKGGTVCTVPPFGIEGLLVCFVEIELIGSRAGRSAAAESGSLGGGTECQIIAQAQITSAVGNLECAGSGSIGCLPRGSRTGGVIEVVAAGAQDLAAVLQREGGTGAGKRPDNRIIADRDAAGSERGAHEAVGCGGCNVRRTVCGALDGKISAGTMVFSACFDDQNIAAAG